ncbi:MAG: serine hydrolase domain-containing protein, partial [Candidatus Acidiferrales bacterium]
RLTASPTQAMVLNGGFRRVVLILCLLLCLHSPLWSQSPTGNASEDRQKMEAVDKFIRERVSPRIVPSITLSVVRHGKVLYESGYGLADREKRVSATPDTPYYVASVTKALTGTSLVILEAEDKIDLNRPANDYLHSAKLHSPMWDVSGATVHRVANHTAGLTTYDRTCVVGDVHCQVSTEVAIERYGVVFWPPGDHFDYSNLGYGVLGQVISNVSGQSLSEFLEQHIFRPLQMRNCYLSMTGDIHPGSAVNYDDSRVRQPLRVSDTPAASSVRCSAHDLAIFGSFVLGEPVRGQKEILPKDRLRELLYSDKADAGEHCSFGWERNTVEGYVGIFAQGGTEDSSAVLQLIPDAALSIAVISNTGTRIPLEIVKGIVAKLLPAKSTFVVEGGLAGRWSGTVQTWKENVPLAVSISSTSVQAGVGENAVLSPCEKPDVSNARVYCVTRGDLKTPDAPSPPYNIELELYLHEGVLFGAATTSDGTELPFWVKLTREKH